MGHPEIYDSESHYGSVCYERCTFLVGYSNMVDMLKTCPHTLDYYRLLSTLKAFKKADALENALNKELFGYADIDKSEPYSEETGWKNGQIGFIINDSLGQCEVVSLYISYSLLADMIRNCKDEEYKQKCIDYLKTCYKSKELSEKVNDLL